MLVFAVDNNRELFIIFWEIVSNLILWVILVILVIFASLSAVAALVVWIMERREHESDE